MPGGSERRGQAARSWGTRRSGGQQGLASADRYASPYLFGRSYEFGRLSRQSKGAGPAPVCQGRSGLSAAV